MRKILMIGVVLMAGCGPSSPKDTVESLVAHPDRLREVEQQCSDDYVRMSAADAAECNAAFEARHRLFMGNGKPPYTPSKTLPKF